MSEKATISPQIQVQPAAAATLKADKDPMLQIDMESLMRMPIQRKLAIGAVDDPLENEADAVAEKIMRMPLNMSFGRSIGSSIQRRCNHCEEEENDGIAQRKPQLPFIQKKQLNGKICTNGDHPTAKLYPLTFLQRKCSHCAEEEQLQRKLIAPFVQRKPSDSQSSASESISQSIQSSRGNGEQLAGETKQFMESRFGADFSGVKIHNGADAANLSSSLNAQAFTVGNDIYFNAGKFSPNSNEGKQLLAHELTHTIQQNGSVAIQRKPGAIAIDPIYTTIDKDFNIKQLRKAMDNMGAPYQITQVMVLNGTSATLYNLAEKKEGGFEKKQVGQYTIKQMNLPSYYLVGLANGKLSILGTQEVEMTDNTFQDSSVLIGAKNSTPAEQTLYDAVNKQLAIPDWFTSEKDKNDYLSKLVNPGFAVIVMPGGGGSENRKQEEDQKPEVPPMPDWMGAYQAAMLKLIKEIHVAEPKSIDLPDTFYLYYSHNLKKWRAGANQSTADPKKPLQVYFDIDKKDDKSEKLQEIRDKIRIRQLHDPTTNSKDSKPLDPALDWAYRKKLELDVKIGEDRKAHPGAADLPDKTGIITKDDDSTTVYLKLWLYITTKDGEGNPASELRIGVLSTPLLPATDLNELFEAVKSATLALRGNEIKPFNEDPTKYKNLLVPFPAVIESLNIRDDFRSVTGAELEMYMNLNTSAVPGMDNVSEMLTHFRGILYTWDVYRVSEVVPSEELNKMPKDWIERRKQLQGWFKNSGQLAKANPVLKENIKVDVDTMTPEMLKTYRNFELTYGLKTGYDANGTINMPKTEGDYVIYCRAVAEPGENTYRYPSEAFYTVNLVDGYKLAEGVRDERLNEMGKTITDIDNEKDDQKKAALKEKLAALQSQEKRTLGQGADYNIDGLNSRISLAQKLQAYYSLANNPKTKVTDLILEASNNKKITDDEFNQLLDLWKIVETTELDKKPVDKLAKLITDAQKNIKQINEMKDRMGKFSSELKGYDIQPAPVVGLVSRVTGQVYPLLLTIGVGSEMLSGRTHAMLVDVTTGETQGSYEGTSDKPRDQGGYEEAVQDAFIKFGEKCAYGEGYIAYRVPGSKAQGRAESAPGIWEKVKHVLTVVAAVAGIAALIIGTVFSGGALAVVAGYVGVGAMVVGAGLAIDNIYDRASNHRLHADVELAMDILSIAGPVLQGAGALAKLSKVATLKSLINIAEIGGEAATGEKSVLTAGMLGKLGTIMKLERTLMLLQKAEAVTNLGLIGYKTYKDLAMVAEVYADDPKKMAVMQAEIIRNAVISGTFAVIALHGAFKVNVDELDGLANDLAREGNYESAMKKAGLKDADGNWVDQKLKEHFLGKEAEVDKAAGSGETATPGAKTTTDKPTTETSTAENNTVRTKTPEGEPLGDFEGKKVASELDFSTTHKAKVLENGECAICSTCESIRGRFKEELAANADMETELKGYENTLKTKPTDKEAILGQRKIYNALNQEKIQSVGAKVRAIDERIAAGDRNISAEEYSEYHRNKRLLENSLEEVKDWYKELNPTGKMKESEMQEYIEQGKRLDEETGRFGEVDKTKSLRQQYMGGTPGKDSKVGREVMDRMDGEGRMRNYPPYNKFTEFKDADGYWYNASEADMGHYKVAAVEYWNATGKFKGARSKEVRDWMNDSKNYELEHFSRNRSAGAKSGKTYDPPVKK